MKVALLIFPLHYSHGSILQTFALYSKLKQLGHDVTILDRQPSSPSVLKWGKKVVVRMAKTVLKRYKGPIFYQGNYPKQIMAELQPFIDRFKERIISITSTEELRDKVIKGRFDAIVVGSDQTWRPQNVPNVMDYWLDFAHDMKIRKVAYAPSFGVDEWEYSDAQTVRCKELAKLFNGLSVRENSGVALCEKNLRTDAVHVLDPTMLWEESFYAPIAQKYLMKQGLCTCYFLDKSSEKVNIANRIAEAKHLEVNYVNTRSEDSDAPLKERIAPSMEHWLSGFMNGEFVVVDSFHAMVFSIIFHKPFVVIGNRRRGMSRFESLLGELGLTDRMVKDADNVEDVAAQEINWNEVELRLGRHREESIHFLLKALAD